MMLGTLDWVLMSLALGAFLFAGFTGLRGRADVFLISGRSLASPLSGSTIAASKIGAGAIITYTALVFQFGFGALWLFFGYIFGYGLFYMFAIPLSREAREVGFYTLADFFAARYGSKAALAVGGLCAVSLFGWVITNFVAGGRILAHASGWAYPVCVAVIIAIVVPYLMAGGFRSVVRTDAIQYAAIVLVLLLVATKVLLGGGAELQAPNGGGSMPIGLIASFFLTGLFFPMGSTELWQRVYATKDARELRKAILIASMSFVVVGIALSIIGLRLRSLLAPGLPPELALVDGIAGMLGAGFLGLIIVAFLAAIVSSADTFVYTTAAVIAHDLWDRDRSNAGEKVVKMIRLLIPLVAVLGFAGALLFGNVVAVTFVFAGLTMSVGVLVIAAWMSRALTGTAVVVAVVGGVLGVVVPSVTLGVSVLSAVGGLAGATLGLGLGALLGRSSKRQAAA